MVWEPLLAILRESFLVGLGKAYAVPGLEPGLDV